MSDEFVERFRDSVPGALCGQAKALSVANTQGSCWPGLGPHDVNTQDSYWPGLDPLCCQCPGLLVARPRPLLLPMLRVLVGQA